MKPPKFLSWAMIAALAWGVGFIYNVRLGGEPRWLSQLYFNKMAIAANTPAPKLIVTGGSGAHYTINADILTEELNLPVVNLGLDGPVGLDVILSSVLAAVKPGDVVLLIPEHLILEADNGLGEKSGWFGIAIGQPGLGGIPAKQLAFSTLQLGIPSLKWAVKSAADLVEEGRFTGYYDGPLTERGDPIDTKQREGDWWQLRLKQSASPHAIARIEQFKTAVEARGGELILSIPWMYGDLSDERSLAAIRQTAVAFGQIAPTLVDEDTMNIQSQTDLFADTHYHLKPEGRALRSHQLAEQLKPLLLEMQ